MSITRRDVGRMTVGAGLTAPALLRVASAWAAARTIRINHQYPGGTIEQGDFRDRLARRFAAEVGKRSNGELAVQIFPNASLMKTVAQFSALRRGVLDMSVCPLAYGGGEVPEANIGLMPMLTTSYRQGLGWKDAEIGRQLVGILEKRGVKIITWIWQAGGCASRTGAVVRPEDVRGLKIRGGARQVDLMLKQAGGIVSSVSPDGIYAAMQTGKLDAAVISSTSLIGTRLHEVSKSVTTGRKGSFWFVLEPLLMSRAVFESLTPSQQTIVTEVGASLETFGLEQARADDEALAVVYGEAGAKVADFDAPALAAWKTIAEETAWKDYAARNATCANLLKLAQSVPG